MGKIIFGKTKLDEKNHRNATTTRIIIETEEGIIAITKIARKSIKSTIIKEGARN